MENNNSLKCIHVISWKDPLHFKHPFVWITIKLLVNILESQNACIQLLGVFLVVVMVRAKAEIALQKK